MTVYVYRGKGRLDDPILSSEGRPHACHGVRGTIAGYGRHKRRGERPCDKCREAMNAYNRERRREWEQVTTTKAADRLRRKARARALAALSRLHPGEFRSLQQRELGRLLDEQCGSRAVGA